MGSVIYDYNKLVQFDEFDADSVSANFDLQQVYFDRLTNFANNSNNMLTSYNPTVVIFGEEVRSEFLTEMNLVRDMMHGLGIKPSATEIGTLEDAINSMNEKELSDGLIKFGAKAKIISDHIRQAQIVSAPSEPAPTKNRPLIFAVDDSPVFLNMIREILGGQYKVITIASGHEAILAVEKYNPELFLLDVEMPEMSGHELAEKLKSDERFKKTPVIFVTSSAVREHVFKAKKLGVTDYILKPFNRDVLIKKVSTYLKTSH